jgi:hypothetical protein
MKRSWRRRHLPSDGDVPLPIGGYSGGGPLEEMGPPVDVQSGAIIDVSPPSQHERYQMMLRFYLNRAQVDRTPVDDARHAALMPPTTATVELAVGRRLPSHLPHQRSPSRAAAYGAVTCSSWSSSPTVSGALSRAQTQGLRRRSCRRTVDPSSRSVRTRAKAAELDRHYRVESL